MPKSGSAFSRIGRNRVREIIHNTDVNRSVVKIVFDAAPVNCLQANDVFFAIDIRTAAVQASFASL
jgi:hypothetical protein